MTQTKGSKVHFATKKLATYDRATVISDDGKTLKVLADVTLMPDLPVDTEVAIPWSDILYIYDQDQWELEVALSSDDGEDEDKGR